jgi:hypothetical protein
MFSSDTHRSGSALFGSVLVAVIGWVCAAFYGAKTECIVVSGPDPMPMCGPVLTPVFYLGYFFMLSAALTFFVVVTSIVRRHIRLPYAR